MVQFSHFCTRTVLLWSLHARAASAAHLPSGGDPFAMDSGFDEEDFDELDRHIDDIYSQSEVRVLCTLLTPTASQACLHFAKTERRVQRAYLWRGLKLGNIHFVHAGASHSPHDIVSIKRPTLLTDDILDEELDNFDASEATRDAVRSLLSEGHDVSVEHVRNMKWNVDHLETFFSKIQGDLRYNDMPDRVPATQVEAVAYDDPRFADNEDVVNYRVNWRQLARERLSFLSTPWFARDKEEGLLKWAIDEIDLDDLPDLDEDEARAMIVKELTHRASDIIVESKLQSNFQDPPRGEVYPESTLHLVGGRSRGVDDIAVCVNDVFTRFTPTGRPDLGNLYRPNVGEVAVWRSPYERVKPRDGIDAEAKFVADFREKVKTMQLKKSLAWTVPDQILMRSDADHIPGMWPENPNMYLETVLRSWYDTDRNEWSEGGIETHSGLRCLQL